MRVRTRLILLGAVVPVVALLALTGIAGLILNRRLHTEVDEHLLAQAAVESVGLFDGVNGEPHLHAHRSPLQAELHGLLPVGAIYAADGALQVITHDDAEVPKTLRATSALGAVTLRTTAASGAMAARRELISAVASPAGTRYTLYLAVELERVEHTMQRYWTTAGIAVLAIALMLALVQGTVATRLARRIGWLHAYLPRLREGQSEPPPPDDATGDELAALRDGLYDAARQLERSRAERERGLADAAHDLRTPLGIIRTTIDLALRKPRSEPELRAALAELRGECERLTALTATILSQRRGDRSRIPVDLREVIRVAVRGMAPLAAEAGVELRGPGMTTAQLVPPPGAVTTGTLGAPGTGPIAARPPSAVATAPNATRAPTAPLAPAAWILGDATQLRRILDNLLHNAITHSPRGGRIVIDLHEHDHTWHLEVRDQGKGIAADQLEQVFQAFVHDPSSRGAGLGLAIVRQVAAEHGGEAWAQPGPGGRIIVELPAAS